MWKIDIEIVPNDEKQHFVLSVRCDEVEFQQTAIVTSDSGVPSVAAGCIQEIVSRFLRG